jgi:Cupin-like domain
MDWCTRVNEIEEMEPPTLRRLLDDYLLPGKPAVIRDALRGTGLEAWSPSYLKDRVGATRVRASHAKAEGESKSGPLRMFETTLSEFIDTTVLSPAVGASASAYLQQSSIPALFPDLEPEIPVAKFILPDLVTALNLWLGPPNTVAPLHYDGGNNFLIQVYGVKRVTLFEAWQTPLLYPNDVRNHSRLHVSAVDIVKPDFDAHPKVRQAIPTIVELKAGDVLFIPSCCWHEVHGLTASISINIWWRQLDQQLMMPSYTRLLPRLYERPPNFFHRSIRKDFGSLADYARALRSIGEHRASALCHVMLLERFLELRGRHHGMTFGDGVGLEASARLARRLADANALSHDELRQINGWLALGTRLLNSEATEDEECRTMQDATAAYIGVADLDLSSGRVLLEALV